MYPNLASLKLILKSENPKSLAHGFDFFLPFLNQIGFDGLIRLHLWDLIDCL